jgi:hypothetical protein
VEYEETGWYDAQTWVKTPEMLTRDRLLGLYTVRPAVERLQTSLLSLGGEGQEIVFIFLAFFSFSSRTVMPPPCHAGALGASALFLLLSPMPAPPADAPMLSEGAYPSPMRQQPRQGRDQSEYWAAVQSYEPWVLEEGAGAGDEGVAAEGASIMLHMLDSSDALQ